MKKIFVFSFLAGFILSFLAISSIKAEEVSTTDNAAAISVTTAAPTTPALEKISSPDQMRNFKNIIKRGTALFGIRINNQEVKKPESKPSLEKIANPKDINLFKEIKKIGTALWGIRKEIKNENKAQISYGPEMATCITTAIKAKDTALIASNSEATTAINGAISARTTCQEQALAKSEGQKEALDACLKSFRETQKESKKKGLDTHQSIWKTYNESFRACRDAAKTASATPALTETPLIEDGGGNILNISE